jgi:hypothetical protein
LYHEDYWHSSPLKVLTFAGKIIKSASLITTGAGNPYKTTVQQNRYESSYTPSYYEDGSPWRTSAPQALSCIAQSTPPIDMRTRASGREYDEKRILEGGAWVRTGNEIPA